MFLNVVNNVLEADADAMSAAIQSGNASARWANLIMFYTHACSGMFLHASTEFLHFWSG